MRKFAYFLYDGFEPDEVKKPEDDPRLVLNGEADGILSEIVETPCGRCNYGELCSGFSKSQVDSLIHIGLLSAADKFVFLDAPVIVREDALHLRRCFSDYTAQMAQTLMQHREEFFALAREIENGFPPEVNLYHLLCGASFDGSFFEHISDSGVVTTSRVHPSGLDYLIIVYEIDPKLDRLSRELLCSYNRYSDGHRTLQSFGDADGDRRDFFRFAMQKYQGKVPQSLKDVERIWDAVGMGDIRKKILGEAEQFAETGRCEENCRRILTEFGYIKKGKLAVPVYRKKNIPVIEKLERLTERCISEKMKEVLTAPEVLAPLRCVQWGVPTGEVANELYHIVFGQLNELLVEEKFVARPRRFEGQGRYLQSIELF